MIDERDVTATGRCLMTTAEAMCVSPPAADWFTCYPTASATPPPAKTQPLELTGPTTDSTAPLLAPALHTRLFYSTDLTRRSGLVSSPLAAAFRSAAARSSRSACVNWGPRKQYKGAASADTWAMSSTHSDPEGQRRPPCSPAAHGRPSHSYAVRRRSRSVAHRHRAWSALAGRRPPALVARTSASAQKQKADGQTAHMALA